MRQRVDLGRLVRMVVYVAGIVSVATTPTRGESARALDPVFRNLLPALAASTWVPIVLPATMPDLYANHATLYASIDRAVTARNRYEVSLESTPDCGGSHWCSVASFVGEVASGDRTPPGSTPVALANGVRGHFEAGRCGASCGDSRLEWRSGPDRYVVYVHFESKPAGSVVLANAMIAGKLPNRPRARPIAIEYGSRVDGIGTVLARGLDPRNTPSAVAVTNDGAVWFRETFTWHPRIGRFAPDGSFREVQDPYVDSSTSANAFVASGNDVLVGPTEARGSSLTIHRVAPDGTVDIVDVGGCFVADSSFACFASHRGRPDGYFGVTSPNSVVRGPRGDLWFTDSRDSLIGRISPSGKRSIFRAGLTRYHSGPQFITTGPDGNMWFTEQRDRIGRITQDGKITEFSRGIPRRASLGGIVAGPDGNLWFTLYHGMVLGKIMIDGRITLYHDLVYPSDGHDFDPVATIVRDRAGRLYYNEGQAGRIARVTVR